MKVYRIYTENTQRARKQIMDTVSHEFDGFTVFDAVGYWNGIPEKSMVIEIIAGGSNQVKDTVRALAWRIREIGGQECVMMTVQDVEMDICYKFALSRHQV